MKFFKNQCTEWFLSSPLFQILEIKGDKTPWEKCWTLWLLRSSRTKTWESIPIQWRYTKLGSTRQRPLQVCPGKYRCLLESTILIRLVQLLQGKDRSYQASTGVIQGRDRCCQVSTGVTRKERWYQVCTSTSVIKYVQLLQEKYRCYQISKSITGKVLVLSGKSRCYRERTGVIR